MDHPLRRQVQRIAQRARWLLVIRGGAWFIAVSLLVALVAGMLDYGLRSQDLGLRFLITLAAAVVILVAFWRYLLPVLGYHSDEVATARWIERCRPEWRDELSSAIAFLRAPQNERTSGSPQLRSQHIQAVTARLDRHPLSGCLRYSYSIRPLLFSAAAALTLVIVCWVDPASARIAALRLISPWSELNWPRRNHLALISPMTRLAAGQDFEAIVTDRTGELPQDTTIHYWLEGATEDAVEKVAMTYAGGRMVHRMVNVTRPFRYRVTGGDDQSMDWIQLEVVEPPQLKQLSVIIHPPRYTGWKSYEAAGPFQALQGSRIDVQVALSEPVVQATLRADPSVIANASSNSLACVVDEDGLGIRSPGDEESWTLGGPGRYWIEITGRDGITLPTRVWDVQSFQDEAPSVRLTHTATGSVIGTKARLPVSLGVDDDIGIQSIDVRVRAVGDAEPLLTMPLWNGPELLEEASVVPLGARDEQTASGIVEFERLSLAAGQTVELVATARDYRPQEGRSAAVPLRVVSDDELEDRLAQLQSRLLATVDRALLQERDTRAQTRSLELQFEEQSNVQPRHADVLKGIDLHQRQVDEMLTSAPDSALAQADAILSEIRLNQLPLEAVEQQMETVLNTLRQWQAAEIPLVERSLLSATKLLSDHLERGAGVTPELQEVMGVAGEAQQELMTQLEQLASQLAEWEGFRRFAGEVRQLIRDQQRLSDESATLRGETLGQALSQLKPEQRAQLRRVAQQQMDLVRRLDHLISRMLTAEEEAREQDPKVAEALRRALETADTQAIAVQMRQSAQAAQRNQLSEAASHQRGALDGLNELLNALTGRTSSPHDSPSAQAASAAQEISNLQREQDQLDDQRERMAASSSTVNAADREQWAQQQRQLSQRAAQLARQMQRARMTSAAPIQQAAEAMSQAAEHVSQSEFPEADAQADVARQALDEAANRLANAAATQQQHAWSHLKQKLIDVITGALESQRTILSHTEEFEELRQSQSLFSPEQQAAVRSLAAEQQQIADTLEPLAAEAERHRIIVYILDQVTNDSSEAAARLLQVDTGQSTQQLQQRAVARMEQVLAGLQQQEPEDDPPPAAANQQPQQSPNQSQQPGREKFVSIEELQLLQILQEELARRTQSLIERRATEQNTAGWQNEQRRLAAEQGRISEILLELFSAENESASEPTNQN